MASNGASATPAAHARDAAFDRMRLYKNAEFRVAASGRTVRCQPVGRAERIDLVVCFDLVPSDDWSVELNNIKEREMRYSDRDVVAKGVEIFGIKPLLPDEIATAKHLLDCVPHGLTPLQVAQHLAALRDKNKDGESYIAEWEVRSNPIITQFFAATDYGGGGLNDQVPWCAALVNWCLWRAQYTRSNSSSSGSFRCFGTAAYPLRVGDIAVFKNRGQDATCSGHGHVAFWLSQSVTDVSFLGGNQGNKIKISKYRASEAPTHAHRLIGVQRI